MIVHGTLDDVVPLSDARVLADSAVDCELRVITGAGHRLRHDPRAVAVLLGWMERQAV
jgi:putative redox protein